MAKHHLHRPEVSPTFQKMGRKGMPEGVWMNLFLQPRFEHVFFYNFPKSLPRQFLP
jgi:hypothetical protein